MTKIEVQQVGKFYDTRKVLEGVSFGVEDGEIVSVLGSSGCGKTTLLRCILGLELLDEGNIFIDTQKHTEWLKNKRIAYVPQKYGNFNYLTVEKNILGVLGKARQNQVDQILKSVGLEGCKKMYPGQLSGGMQQRLALARALAQDANIIAFDESLNALDVETRQQMQELILRLWAGGRKTIIFVTHDIEEALFLSKKIVVMGANPGVVRKIFDIPFSYPRTPALRYGEEFQKIRRTLSGIIRSEHGSDQA